ncbi:hypothetical protein QCA50_007255 [Cerrena zonata]|uniref:Uncharacterized protein n=1 Tax=Cerrena zonata TaxID=2478898 RepID=A0AAW0GH08_9APHY
MCPAYIPCLEFGPLSRGTAMLRSGLLSSQSFETFAIILPDGFPQPFGLPSPVSECHGRVGAETYSMRSSIVPQQSAPVERCIPHRFPIFCFSLTNPFAGHSLNPKPEVILDFCTAIMQRSFLHSRPSIASFC